MYWTSRAAGQLTTAISPAEGEAKSRDYRTCTGRASRGGGLQSRNDLGQRWWKGGDVQAQVSDLCDSGSSGTFIDSLIHVIVIEYTLCSRSSSRHWGT